MTRYAELVVNLPIDRPFHYEIPEDLDGTIQIGSRILVPFRNRDREGFCLGFVDEPEIPFVRKVKKVLDEEPTADARLLNLTRWVADRFVSSHGEAIFAAIPSGARKKNPGRKIALLQVATPPDSPPRNDNQRRVLEALRESGRPELQSDILGRFPRSAVDALVKRGWVKREFVRPEIDVLAGVISEPPKEIALTPEQERALEVIAEGPGTVLLHGVTASGKTEAKRVSSAGSKS